MHAARACLPLGTRDVVVASADGARRQPKAFRADRDGAMADVRKAADAHPAALGGFVTRVRSATHASHGHHAVPCVGALHTLLSVRYHEAGGKGMTERAAAVTARGQWRASRVWATLTA